MVAKQSPTKPAPTATQLAANLRDTLLRDVYANMVAGDRGTDEPVTEMPTHNLVFSFTRITDELEHLRNLVGAMPEPVTVWFLGLLSSRLVEDPGPCALDTVAATVNDAANDLAKAGAEWNRWFWEDDD